MILSVLAKKLNLEPEEGKKWIIKSLPSVNAKLSANNQVIIPSHFKPVYEQLLEKTNDLTSRMTKLSEFTKMEVK